MHKKLLFLSLLIVCSSFVLAACPDGLVSYWRFDNALTDESGKYNGTMGIYGSYTAGKINNSLAGAAGCSNPFAAKVNNFPNLDSFTIETWIKPSCPPGSRQGSLTISKLRERFQSGYKHMGFVLFTTPNPYSSSNYIFQFTINNETNSAAVTSPSNYTCGNWYHVAVIRDYGQKIKLFVNGQEVANTSDTVSSIANTEPLFFQGWSSGGCGWDMSAVNIDETAIYNRTLSAAEINQTYQKGLAGKSYCEELNNPESVPEYNSVGILGILIIASIIIFAVLKKK